MGERLEKFKSAVKYTEVKAHVQRNRSTYVSVSCFAAGIVGTMLVSRSETVSANSVAKVTGLVNLNSPATSNLEQTVMLVRRGHPGNVIKCIETGEVFASQNRAAEALGLNPGEISKNVRGLNAAVKGMHFESLGEAS